MHNRLNEFRFGEDLRQVPPWSLSAWSHTDLKRLRAGHVSAQVRSTFGVIVQHCQGINIIIENLK